MNLRRTALGSGLIAVALLTALLTLFVRVGLPLLLVALLLGWPNG